MNETSPNKEIRPQKTVRVLVVEDEPSIQMLIKRVLDRDSSFGSTFTDNTDDALRILEEWQKLGQSADLVVSDRKVPGRLDGVGLAGETGGGRLTKHLILITGTGYDLSAKPKEELEEMGINSIVHKPASVVDLINRFNEAKKTIISSRLQKTV